MAKKRNKSAAIRMYLGDNATATTQEIIEALALKGVKVRPEDVYNVRATSRRKPGSRDQKPAAAKRTTGMHAGNPVAVVQQVKGLANEVGGLKNLKQLVDVLAER